MTTSRKLRIVHCFRSPVGGIFRHVRDLTEAQVAAGHDVGIVCDSSTGGDFEAEMFASMEGKLALGLKRVPMQRHIGIGDIVSGFRTFSIIRNMQPDILHGHGAKGGVFARGFGSLLRVFRSRVARLYSPHGGTLHYDEAQFTGRLFFLIERLLERGSDHLLFVSEYERDTYIRKVGPPSCPHSLIYNGLGPEEFIPVECAPDAADFLYIGMMRDLKGPDIFLDGLHAAQKQFGGELTAVMVGDGDDLEKYTAQCKLLGLSDKVTFLPPMPARKALALAKTVVVPSRAEAMPYIVLESLAAGKPVIATAVGGIPEVFGAESAALIHPDKSELAVKMVDAQHRSKFFSAMPKESELKARFGVEVMAAQIEESYFAALRG